MLAQLARASRLHREGRGFEPLTTHHKYIVQKTMKKIIVVTGASSGMGRQFVLQIDKKEKVDEIWVIARNKERLEELKKSVSAKIVPISIDLTNREQIKKHYLARLEKEKPEVKILAN